MEPTMQFYQLRIPMMKLFTKWSIPGTTGHHLNQLAVGLPLMYSAFSRWKDFFHLVR